MNGLRLIAVVFGLLLILACFLSAPVFGENPWDADGGNNSDSNTSFDTTGTEEDEAEDMLPDGNEEYNPDWLTGIFFMLSYRFITGYLMDPQVISPSPQATLN